MIENGYMCMILFLLNGKQVPATVKKYHNLAYCNFLDNTIIQNNMIQNNPELFELSMSEKTQPLMDLVKHHCEENIKPIQAEYSALQNEKEDRWSWHPRQIELMEGAKDKARELGLWNFFLPDPDDWRWSYQS